MRVCFCVFVCVCAYVCACVCSERRGGGVAPHTHARTHTHIQTKQDNTHTKTHALTQTKSLCTVRLPRVSEALGMEASHTAKYTKFEDASQRGGPPDVAVSLPDVVGI